MKRVLSLGFLLLTLLIFPKPSEAIVIFGNGPLGDFEATLTYSALNAANATLTLVLKNTSAINNGGYLTAFVFNNPGNRITSALLGSTDPDFNLLGGPGYNNGINGSPYGDFDIGASTGGGFEGGGNPNLGIGVGLTGAFTFTLAGIGLDTIDENSFLSELSSGNGSGEGYQFFVARFRGFENGASNKTPGQVVPEPASLSLLGLGLLGLLGLRKTRCC